MASFAAQAAIRSKWTDLVESTPFDVPGEVSSGVRSVVGWLKQVNRLLRYSLYSVLFLPMFKFFMFVLKSCTALIVCCLTVHSLCSAHQHFMPCMFTDHCKLPVFVQWCGIQRLFPSDNSGHQYIFVTFNILFC